MTPRRIPSSLIAQQRGVVLVEFLIAFVPVFVLFLAIVQLALLAVAQLVVQHAAFAGVRAAVVVLDDEPRFYGGVARGALDGSGAAQSDWEQRFSRQIGLNGTSGEAAAGRQSGPRMVDIERAVYARIAAIVPDASLASRLRAGAAAPTSVGDALGAGPLSRLGFALSGYAAASTAVTLPEAPGSTRLIHDTVGERTTVSVRVTHLFACLVPIAAPLLCSGLSWNARAHHLTAQDLPGAATRALRELRLAPRAAEQRAFAGAGMSFAILSAEATLPAQSARYAYTGEVAASAAP